MLFLGEFPASWNILSSGSSAEIKVIFFQCQSSKVALFFLYSCIELIVFEITEQKLNIYHDCLVLIRKKVRK